MEWFKLSDDVSFLIKTLDHNQVARLWKRRGKGLSDEEIRREIFNSVLIDWKGIPGMEELTREEQIRSLFDCRPIQEFILRKSTELLEADVEKIRDFYNRYERDLLKRGKLKS